MRGIDIDRTIAYNVTRDKSSDSLLCQAAMLRIDSFKPVALKPILKKGKEDWQVAVKKKAKPKSKKRVVKKVVAKKKVAKKKTVKAKTKKKPSKKR